MAGDIFSTQNLPRDFWLVKVGESKDAGFLTDCQSGGKKGVLVFTSKKKAEQEAKDMNATRQRMKMEQVYFAVKGRKEDIEGCSVLLQ